MSARVSALVWRHARASGPQLLMLLAIAHVADDSGRASISIGRLAAMCGISVSHARTVLTILRAKGELAASAGKPGDVNQYVVTVDEPDAPDCATPPLADVGAMLQRIAGRT